MTARPFSRPPLDPALFISDLPIDARGALAVPGNQAFWTRVFAADGDPDAVGTVEPISAAPPDVTWLLEQVFDGGLVRSKLRAEQVLFAARVFGGLRPADAADAAAALAALGRYSALIRAIERLGIHDPGVFGRAVRRAASIASIDARDVRAAALAQYQGALALVSRAALRGSVPPADVPRLVDALSAVALDESDEYGGGVARWIDQQLRPLAPGEPATTRAQRRSPPPTWSRISCSPCSPDRRPARRCPTSNGKARRIAST